MVENPWILIGQLGVASDAACIHHGRINMEDMGIWHLTLSVLDEMFVLLQITISGPISFKNVEA